MTNDSGVPKISEFQNHTFEIAFRGLEFTRAIRGCISRYLSPPRFSALDEGGLEARGWKGLIVGQRVDAKSFKLGDGRGKHRRVRMADESQQESQPAPKERKLIRHMPLLTKVLEVVLAVFSIGLIVDPLNSFQRISIRTHFKLDDAAIIYITIAGFLIINTLFIICQLMGDRIPKRTLIVFSSVGALLHIVAGSIIVYNWRKILGPYYNNNEYYPSKQYMDMFISGAVFTFVNAVVFFLEVFFIIYSSKSSE